MHVLEPARGRAFERALGQAEQGLDLRRDEDLVGADVPVEDEIARAGQRERPALRVGDQPCEIAPPAKACWITVKPISSTISTRPPNSAGATRSRWNCPVTVKLAAVTQTASRNQVGISITARS
jgi:hypothetical protein